MFLSSLEVGVFIFIDVLYPNIVSYDNNVIYYKYVYSEAAAAKPKISFLSNFPLRGGGCGGSRNKNDRKFLGFAPRELVERGRGASLIRQNPADFVRNTFELRPIPIFNFGGRGGIRAHVGLSPASRFRVGAVVTASVPFHVPSRRIE